MQTRPPSDPLNIAEQVALIQTLGDVPLHHVMTGSVTAKPLDNGKVLIEWAGVALIPAIQLESIRRVVAAEQNVPEGEN